MFYPAADEQHQDCSASKRACAARWLLALLVCIFASLCIHTAFATERLLVEMRMTNLAVLPTGLQWQHPLLVLSLAIIVALTGLCCLSFIRDNRRAILFGLTTASLLLIYWLVVTIATFFTMMHDLK
jgi:hypothetical protein